MPDNILQTIAAHARERVAAAKEAEPPGALQKRALAVPAREGFAFEAALRTPGMSLICECKKASPSKGLIDPEFDYMAAALEYEQGGAAAISVLTEPKWFLGADEYLQQIAAAVRVPCLRKDFVVDEYMIWQARALGACAVLLICSLLDRSTLREWIALSAELGLSALVEAHDEREIEDALAAGARIVGVNNRNLKTFSVDFGNSGRLRALVPPEAVFVAESGVRGPDDVRRLRDIGADAVLVGEALMRAPDKKTLLREMACA